MSSIVLDASAVLAFAKGETGADKVAAVQSQAMLSAVNHMEVVSKLLRHGLPVAEIARFMDEAFPNVVPFDAEQAALAGKLHAENLRRKFSYADGACLALACIRGLPVLTGDRKWMEIDCKVDIRLFR